MKERPLLKVLIVDDRDQDALAVARRLHELQATNPRVGRWQLQLEITNNAYYTAQRIEAEGRPWDLIISDVFMPKPFTMEKRLEPDTRVETRRIEDPPGISHLTRNLTETGTGTLEDGGFHIAQTIREVRTRGVDHPKLALVSAFLGSLSIPSQRLLATYLPKEAEWMTYFHKPDAPDAVELMQDWATTGHVHALLDILECTMPDEVRPGGWFRAGDATQLAHSSPLMNRLMLDAKEHLASPLPLLLRGAEGSGRTSFGRHFAAVAAEGEEPLELRSRYFGRSRTFDDRGWEVHLEKILGSLRGGVLFIDDLHKWSPDQINYLANVVKDRAFVGEDGKRVTLTWKAMVITAMSDHAIGNSDVVREIKALADKASCRSLELPELKGRHGDFPALIARLLKDSNYHNDPTLFTDAELASFAERHWPRNLQDFSEMVIDRAAAKRLPRLGPDRIRQDISNPPVAESIVPFDEGRLWNAVAIGIPGEPESLQRERLRLRFDNEKLTVSIDGEPAVKLPFMSYLILKAMALESEEDEGDGPKQSSITSRLAAIYENVKEEAWGVLNTKERNNAKIRKDPPDVGGGNYDPFWEKMAKLAGYHPQVGKLHALLPLPKKQRKEQGRDSPTHWGLPKNSFKIVKN